MLFAAFVSICFIANHSRALTDDVEQRAPNDRGISSLPASSAAAAAAAVGPPLMCDMKLTLERVSEHFYRIGGPAEGPSAHDHLQAQGPLYDEPLKANNPTAVQDSTGEGNSLHWASPGGTTTHQEEKKEGDPQDTPTQGAAGTHETTAVDVQPEAGANAAPTDVTASEERLLRESELCIICCNTMASAVLLFCGHGGLCFSCAQTCFHRSGLCPTCRCPVKGVLELKGREGNQMVEGAQLEGVVRDVAS
ncbi:hypothetical protein, conserved [Eimeria tenella]|uniref:RING-type domain-containing protein n=1 Tax=Eimeria tenella TaxID=5802 RepID=U6L124_EIMTE|nr:hypothetical protein, conserved [Eimeria tenella]CDJ41440.1 hypothetical protein, conserved [Eimeria tenella]|eukprot:XP_013232190.1 hypothetical protein, conserved [Eimeria tenella]